MGKSIRYCKPRIYNKKIKMQLLNTGFISRNNLLTYWCLEGTACAGMDNICNCYDPACREWPNC